MSKVFINEEKLKSIKDLFSKNIGLDPEFPTFTEDAMKWAYKEWVKKADARFSFLSAISQPQHIDNAVTANVTYSTTKLVNLDYDPKLFIPITSGLLLDRIFSRSLGIMPGSNTMIVGDPGIGKSSVLLHLLTKIKNVTPEKRVLFLSAEMNRIDMIEFLSIYPEITNVDILFLNDYYKSSPKNAIEAIFKQGWDVIMIDSIAETIDTVKSTTGMGTTHAESWLLDLLDSHNNGKNDIGAYTAFLLIQQVTKSGQFVGSNRMKHMTTAMMELRYDTKSAGSYIKFSKNRKNNISLFPPLYYKFVENDIEYDVDRFETELKIKAILMNMTTDAEIDNGFMNHLLQDTNVVSADDILPDEDTRERLENGLDIDEDMEDDFIDDEDESFIDRQDEVYSYESEITA